MFTCRLFFYHKNKATPKSTWHVQFACVMQIGLGNFWDHIHHMEQGRMNWYHNVIFSGWCLVAVLYRLYYYLVVINTFLLLLLRILLLKGREDFGPVLFCYFTIIVMLPTRAVLPRDFQQGLGDWLPKPTKLRSAYELRYIPSSTPRTTFLSKKVSSTHLRKTDRQCRIYWRYKNRQNLWGFISMNTM